MPRARRPEWGRRIILAIPIDPQPPVAATDLAATTGLTVAQVSKGVAWLRDAIPDLPLVSSRRGYVLTTDPIDTEKFKRWRGRTAMTVINRCWHGVVQPLVRQIAPATEPMISRQFERLLQDIESLLLV